MLAQISETSADILAAHLSYHIPLIPARAGEEQGRKEVFHEVRTMLKQLRPVIPALPASPLCSRVAETNIDILAAHLTDYVFDIVQSGPRDGSEAQDRSERIIQLRTLLLTKPEVAAAEKAMQLAA